MRNIIHALIPSLALFTAAPGALAGPVAVSFVDAARFTDVGTVPWEAQATLRVLSEHLQRLGERHLSADQTLTVEFLDVDLAGEPRPWRHAGREVRVVRGMADTPRISLRYTLAEPGQPTLAGSESVADMNYSRNSDRGTDPLHFEKRMLETWFKDRLVARRAAPH